jgi:hypothetical protein
VVASVSRALAAAGRAVTTALPPGLDGAAEVTRL